MRCRLTYRANASRITSDKDSPRRSAVSFDCSQSSLETRKVRTGVFFDLVIGSPDVRESTLKNRHIITRVLNAERVRGDQAEERRRG